MGKIIRIKNTLDSNSPYSYLSQPISVGGTTHPVRNTNSFSANWAIQLGNSGEETAEILLLGTSTPSGTALYTVGSARFDHPTDTPVYAIKYDQIIFKRSTLGTAGTATPLTDGTITITPDSLYTQFDDTSGESTYAYRASFVNSVIGTSSETSDSDWLTGTGYSFYSKASIRDRIKLKLWDSKYAKDTAVDGWINEWLEEMSNVAMDLNKDYLLGSTDVSFGTNGLGTITDSDFKNIRRMWFTTNGSDYFTAQKIDITDFNESDMSLFNQSSPFYYNYGDNVFGKLPNGDTGTASILYDARPSVLTNDADELPASMRSYTRSFVDYGVAQARYLDEKEGLADRFMSNANAAKESFRAEMANRNKTGVSFIKLDAPLDGEEWGIFH